MAISESTLHPYIKGLVEENGKLTVTELNKMLREILTLDSDDLTLYQVDEMTSFLKSLEM